MELRGIDFGNVLGASGVQGFFGEGYWFHKAMGPLGPRFTGMTFVAKTATLFPRDGNMPLTHRYTPRTLFPSCIKAKPIRGAMLNAVGLSNPSIGALLRSGRWQKRTEPFMISIASVAGTKEERLEELRLMVETIKFCRSGFSASFGVQLNLSCPNTGHDADEQIAESMEALDIASVLNVPLMPKYSIAHAPIEAICELDKHPACDAICVSNTIPFGWDGIDWKKAWGSTKSPLARFGGGGLSGKTLVPLVCDWITRLRESGFQKPINGGGGIVSEEDVTLYHKAGASSAFFGTSAVLRPWRVRSIIARANELLWT